MDRNFFPAGNIQKINTDTVCGSFYQQGLMLPEQQAQGVQSALFTISTKVAASELESGVQLINEYPVVLDKIPFLEQHYTEPAATGLSAVHNIIQKQKLSEQIVYTGNSTTDNPKVPNNTTATPALNNEVAQFKYYSTANDLVQNPLTDFNIGATSSQSPPYLNLLQNGQMQYVQSKPVNNVVYCNQQQQDSMCTHLLCAQQESMNNVQRVHSEKSVLLDNKPQIGEKFSVGEMYCQSPPLANEESNMSYEQYYPVRFINDDGLHCIQFPSVNPIQFATEQNQFQTDQSQASQFRTQYVFNTNIQADTEARLINRSQAAPLYSNILNNSPASVKPLSQAPKVRCTYIQQPSNTCIMEQNKTYVAEDQSLPTTSVPLHVSDQNVVEQTLHSNLVQRTEHGIIKQTLHPLSIMAPGAGHAAPDLCGQNVVLFGHNLGPRHSTPLTANSLNFSRPLITPFSAVSVRPKQMLPSAASTESQQFVSADLCGKGNVTSIPYTPHNMAAITQNLQSDNAEKGVVSDGTVSSSVLRQPIISDVSGQAETSSKTRESLFSGIHSDGALEVRGPKNAPVRHKLASVKPESSKSCIHAFSNSASTNDLHSSRIRVSANLTSKSETLLSESVTQHVFETHKLAGIENLRSNTALGSSFVTRNLGTPFASGKKSRRINCTSKFSTPVCKRTPFYKSRFMTPWFKSRTFDSSLRSSRSRNNMSVSKLRTPDYGWCTPSTYLPTPRSAKTPKPARTPGSGRTLGSTRSFTSVRSEEAITRSTIVAVVEGRGRARGQVGLAALELHQPVLRLSQFADTHTYTRTLAKLAVLHPSELVVCSSTAGRGVGRLVQESVQEATINAVHRRYFSEGAGLATVKQLAAEDDNALLVQLSSKYYCLAAAAALVRYAEHVHNIAYAPHTLRVLYSSSENTLLIDPRSVRHLELVRGLDGNWRHSLFGVLRHTNTAAGARLLRASLLQPYTAAAAIQSRLNALQYLVEHRDVLRSLQSILGRFPDLDWLLSMCAQQHKEGEWHCEQRINYAIGLKNTMELLPPLSRALSGVSDPMLGALSKSLCCPGADVVSAVLSSVLHDDARIVKGAAAMRTQRCYAIKPDVNSLLDVARKIYSEIIDDITSHVTEVSVEHNLTARVAHNSSRGFHIAVSVPSGKPPTLPDIFIQVQEGRGVVTCTTERLFELDHRSRDTMKEVLIMSDAIITEVLAEVRSRLVPLYGVAEAVAALDLLSSLAHAAALGGWVKPMVVPHVPPPLVRTPHHVNGSLSQSCKPCNRQQRPSDAISDPSLASDLAREERTEIRDQRCKSLKEAQKDSRTTGSLPTTSDRYCYTEDNVCNNTGSGRKQTDHKNITANNSNAYSSGADAEDNRNKFDAEKNNSCINGNNKRNNATEHRNNIAHERNNKTDVSYSVIEPVTISPADVSNLEVCGGGILRIVNGRHPVLDLLCSVPPIANDTDLRWDRRLMLITGPNMSGKSTYLRQVALIQILAQMGSFVPAESATVSVREELFALIAAQDSPENNASTFQMQMMEVAAMLHHCAHTSLVLLDELAMVTHAPEASALCWAITEDLLLLGPAVISATHFCALTRMAHVYPQVRNFHFSSCAAEGGRHRIREGINTMKHYGLNAAKLSALPAELLLHATKLAQAMSPQQQVTSGTNYDRSFLDTPTIASNTARVITDTAGESVIANSAQDEMTRDGVKSFLFDECSKKTDERSGEIGVEDLVVLRCSGLETEAVDCDKEVMIAKDIKSNETLTSSLELLQNSPSSLSQLAEAKQSCNEEINTKRNFRKVKIQRSFSTTFETESTEHLAESATEKATLVNEFPLQVINPMQSNLMVSHVLKGKDWFLNRTSELANCIITRPEKVIMDATDGAGIDSSLDLLPNEGLVTFQNPVSNNIICHFINENNKSDFENIFHRKRRKVDYFNLSTDVSYHEPVPKNSETEDLKMNTTVNPIYSPNGTSLLGRADNDMQRKKLSVVNAIFSGVEDDTTCSAVSVTHVSESEELNSSGDETIGVRATTRSEGW